MSTTITRDSRFEVHDPEALAQAREVLDACQSGREMQAAVIAAVKRASGNDFNVVLSPRRAGDPAAIVAASSKIRDALGWMPQHDNLDEIVLQALNWERGVDRLKASTT